MTEVLASLQGSGFSTWLRESESIWALPTVLTLHTLGLGVLVGAAFIFDLRVLGIGRSIPLGPLRTLFRPMWLGFTINTITGLMLFAADATRKGVSPTFLTKMTFVAVGVATMVVLQREVYGAAATGADADRITSRARTMALVSIVVWSAAITAGRLLAYVVEF